MARSPKVQIGDIHLTAGDPSDLRVKPETPFRILVLGNFRGATSDPRPIADRKPLLIDRDNLDQVLAKIAPSARVPLGPNPRETLTIQFRDLDDFEPDRLFQNLDVFANLGSLRKRLRNPSTFAEAAAEIKGWARTAEEQSPSPPPPAAGTSPEDLLGQLLATPSAPAPTMPGGSDWDRFLKSIVKPHLAAAADPRLPELENTVDEAISAQMRSILHHPEFQALEALWRGVAFLVQRLETDGQLKLFLLDVDQTELTQDVLTAEHLNKSGIYQQLVQRTVNTVGADPWAVVVGHYTFGPNPLELLLLANLAKLSARCGAAFLGAANPTLAGCPALATVPDPDDWQPEKAVAEAWAQIRALPEASHVGLALPRFLLRLPYGRDFRPTDAFAFEELPPGSPHESYLWGNPALACTCLLGQTFAEVGWDLQPGQIDEISQLPIHYYEADDGEKKVKPVAEVLFRDTALERLIELGFIVLISQPNRDVARLAGFSSIAPETALAGPWSR